MLIVAKSEYDRRWLCRHYRVRKYNENHDPANGQFTFGDGGGIHAAISSGLKSAPEKSLDEILAQRKENHSYRFLTGAEYRAALSSGQLSPGPNSAGLLNFSNKPIGVYGASAWREPGMLVEMPNAAIARRATAEFYPSSNDSSAFTRGESIPLSEASRVWGYQWDSGKAVDVSHLFKPAQKRRATINKRRALC